MSGILKVGGSELINDNGGSGSLQWSSGLPSGSIVQIQYTQYTGTCSMTAITQNTAFPVCDGVAGSGTEILNVIVTPKISNSKFLIEAQWQGELRPFDLQHDHIFSFFRGTTHLAQSGVSGGVQVGWVTYVDASNDSSTSNGVFLRYFDAPSISAGTATTWKLAYEQAGLANSSNTGLFTNQTVDTGSGAGNERGISSISVTEIAP